MSFKDELKEFGESDEFIQFGGKHAPDNEFEGVFVVGAKEPDPFGISLSGVPPMRLAFIFKCADGKERKLGTNSKRFARAFDKSDAKPGDTVRIQRIGDGYQTQYQIKVTKRLEKGTTAAAEVIADEIPF